MPAEQVCQRRTGSEPILEANKFETQNQTMVSKIWPVVMISALRLDDRREYVHMYKLYMCKHNSCLKNSF